MRATIVGLLLVLLAPTLLLAPSLVGGRHFVPYDIAAFPPISTTLDADELGAVTRSANNDPTEVVLTFIPELRFAAQELRSGRLPQWNPYARFGVPLQATAVVGLNYPPNWLVLAHEDPRDGLALGAWLSLAIAGGLMFGFLRTLGLRIEAAVLGALVFAISGTLVAQAHFYQRLASLVWLPGLLWGVFAVTERRGLARGPAVAGLAVSVTLTWLAGFPQYGAPALLIAGIYALFRLLHGQADSGMRSFVGGVGWLGLAIALGMLLAAVQILPMTAFFPESSRGAPATATSLASFAMAPAGLLSWLMPTMFGHPHDVAELPYATSAMAYWWLPRTDWATGSPFPTQWNFIEGTIFVGTLTLPLALFAMLRPRSTTERGMVAAFVVTAVLSGGYAWLGWFHLLPGVNSVAPARFVAVLCGPLAVLAAFGLDRIVVERATLRRRSMVAGIGVVAFGALCWFQVVRGMSPDDLVQTAATSLYARFADVLPTDFTADTIAGLMSGPDMRYGEKAHQLLVWNLGRAGIVLVACAIWWGLARWAGGDRRRTNWWLRAGVFGVAVELCAFAAPLLCGRELPVPHDSAVHEFLRSERDRLARDGGYAVVRGTGSMPPARVFPLQLPPSRLVPDRIRDINGYTFLDQYSHLVIQRIWGKEHMIKENVWPYALPDDARLGHPYLDLIGARWVLSEDKLEHAGKSVGPVLSGERGGYVTSFHVYEREAALPRAFVVPRLEVVADDQGVIEALANPDLEPRAAAWVTRADAPSGATSGDAAAVDRDVEFVRDDVQELELRVASGPPGWLVLNDSWFSGWSATVDDEPAELVRVNLAMRALRVPARETDVTFRYQPPRFAAGVFLSGVAAASLLLLALIGLVLRRRAAPPAPAVEG